MASNLFVQRGRVYWVEIAGVRVRVRAVESLRTKLVVCGFHKYRADGAQDGIP